jgi:hypothetical protein
VRALLLLRAAGGTHVRHDRGGRAAQQRPGRQQWRGGRRGRRSRGGGLQKRQSGAICGGGRGCGAARQRRQRQHAARRDGGEQRGGPRGGAVRRHARSVGVGDVRAHSGGADCRKQRGAAVHAEHVAAGVARRGRDRQPRHALLRQRQRARQLRTRRGAARVSCRSRGWRAARCKQAPVARRASASGMWCSSAHATAPKPITCAEAAERRRKRRVSSWGDCDAAARREPRLRCAT